MRRLELGRRAARVQKDRRLARPAERFARNRRTDLRHAAGRSESARRRVHRRGPRRRPARARRYQRPRDAGRRLLQLHGPGRSAVQRGRWLSATGHVAPESHGDDSRRDRPRDPGRHALHGSRIPARRPDAASDRDGRSDPVRRRDRLAAHPAAVGDRAGAGFNAARHSGRRKPQGGRPQLAGSPVAGGFGLRVPRYAAAAAEQRCREHAVVEVRLAADRPRHPAGVHRVPVGVAGTGVAAAE